MGSRPGVLAIGLLLGAGVVGVLTGCAGTDAPTARQVVIDGDPERGAVAIDQYGCTSCHAVPGVSSVQDPGVGPDLHGFADRRFIAGHVPNRPEELIRWLLDPQEIDPGNLMPDSGLTEQEARDVAAYLYDN